MENVLAQIYKSEFLIQTSQKLEALYFNVIWDWPAWRNAFTLAFPPRKFLA